MANPTSFQKLGVAWVTFCVALAVHVTDEALTGFLSIYNPTVVALRGSFRFWPPTFTFRVWLAGLIFFILLLLALSPFVFRNAPWMRLVVYFCTVVAGIVNAIGHTVATILGRTVTSVSFPRPAPGFYSSPLLFLAAAYTLVQLKKTKPSALNIESPPHQKPDSGT